MGGIRIQEHDPRTPFREDASERERELVGPEDGHAIAIGCADAEHPRNKARGDTLEHDGDRNGQEDQGAELGTTRDSFLTHDRREERGNCRRHDAPRCNPGQKGALATVEFGRQRAHPNVQRSHQENQRRHRETAGNPERPYVGQAHVGGKQHEEQADHPNRQVLLEFKQVAAHPRAHVAEDGSGNHHSKDSRIGHEGIAAGEEYERSAQRNDVLEAFGNGAAYTQQPRQREPEREACQGAKTQPQQEPLESRRKRRLSADHDLQGHRRDDGADGIDEDALGFEHRRQARAYRRVAQERADHRRTRHDDEGSEDDRQVPAPSHQRVGGQRGSRGGDQRAHRDQVANRTALAAQTREVEIEATFEEDDGNAEFHDGEEAVAQGLGFDPSEEVGA